MQIKTSNVTLAILAGFALSGCVSNGQESTTDQPVNAGQTEEISNIAPTITVTDTAFLSEVTNEHTSYEVVENGLKVTFDEITQSEANSKWPNIKFHNASGPMDWSTKKGVELVLENVGAEEVRIEMKVADNIGIMGAAAHQLDLPIYLPAGEVKQVQFLFDGAVKQVEGYRGGSQLDLSKIAEFQFYSVGPIGEQTVIIQNVTYID